MIGTVEIYADFNTPNQKLVSSESNLIVNGAAENLCTLLTTPSGIVSGAVGITDSSNFTIQALSLGKSSDAYRSNAHFYPQDVSSYIRSGREYYTYVNAVKDASNIPRAVSLVNENISYTACSYDPKRDPGMWPNPNDTQLEPDTRTAIDIVSGQYHYMGSNVMQGRAHSYGHNLNRIQSNTNPNLISYSEDPTADSAGAYWTVANLGSSSLSATHSGPEYSSSALLLSSTHNTTGRLEQDISLLKTCFHHNTDHTYSVYIKLPDTNATSSITLNIRDNTPSRKGYTAQFVTYDESVSSYMPPVVSALAGTTAKVTPVGDATTSSGWYRLEVAHRGTDSDGNFTDNGDEVQTRITFKEPGFKPTTGAQIYVWGPQLEESYGATRYQPVTTATPVFDEGGVAGDTFLGCYPHTSGTPFAILSDISYMEDNLSNILASAVYPDTTDRNYFNSSYVRYMDQNGYIRSYFPSATKTAQAWPHDITNPASGLIVSADVNFSSTGEVSCITTIASADLGLANLYGGIFKCGLWTIDLEKTLSDTDEHGNPKLVPSFPLNFNTGYNKLVYKLFAEKSLTKNLAAVKDDGSNAGCIKYSDLTLVWRLNFI